MTPEPGNSRTALDDIDETRDQLALYHDRFTEKIRTSPDSLRFGPTYAMKTSKGEPLKISTVFINNYAFKERLIAEIGPENVDRFVFLVAQDSQGNILGVESVQFTYQNQVGVFILTFEKNRGISTPLSLACMDVIQRYANEIQKPVEGEITNYNLQRLQELQAENHKKVEGVTDGIIAEKKAEQARWQTNWGDRGKFGLMDGKGTINPNGLYSNLEEIRTVDLEISKNAETGVISAVPTQEEIHPGKVEEIRREKLTLFAELLQKMAA